MKIAVLFDGAGLARLGLERAGHTCIGFELDPAKHFLGRFVGEGHCVLADALTVDLSGFDAVWASPPCQSHSVARTQGPVKKVAFGQGDLLAQTLDKLSGFKGVTWVENVISPATEEIMGGAAAYNAAQFLVDPIQNRSRLIWGSHPAPEVFHPYRKAFPGICPCITATEQKGCASDRRRASRFYGRRLTLQECAFHQGFDIPAGWVFRPADFAGSATAWRDQQYEAIGNGVPVYMAEAFGRAAL